MNILQTMSSHHDYVSYKAMCTARVAILQFRKWLKDLPGLITAQNGRFATVSKSYNALLEKLQQDQYLYCGWRPCPRTSDIYQTKDTLSLYAQLGKSSKNQMNIVLKVGIREEFMVGHIQSASLFPAEYPFCSYDVFRAEVMDNILRRSLWQQPHLANNCFYFVMPGRGLESQIMKFHYVHQTG